MTIGEVSMKPLLLPVAVRQGLVAQQHVDRPRLFAGGDRTNFVQLRCGLSSRHLGRRSSRLRLVEASTC